MKLQKIATCQWTYWINGFKREYDIFYKRGWSNPNIKGYNCRINDMAWCHKKTQLQSCELHSFVQELIRVVEVWISTRIKDGGVLKNACCVIDVVPKWKEVPQNLVRWYNFNELPSIIFFLVYILGWYL
jgi:hypothetical protein